MAASPILRAIPEAGAPWDDPSEDLLFILLQDIEAGDESFLIVERITDSTGQTYAQALRCQDGSYVVEDRDGDAEHHYSTIVADMRTAHHLLAGWAFNLPGWTDHATWSQILRLASQPPGSKVRADDRSQMT